jgi:membrane fusion protein (multidrug efflux system)
MQAVSQQEYTDARAQARQANAAVAQNRASLETANGSTCASPACRRRSAAGSAAPSFTTGALVTANQADPLTTIQRLDPIFVDIQQSSAELLACAERSPPGGAVPSRAKVRLTLEDGSDYGFTGTVEFAEAMVDPATGTVTLRATFPNPQGLLLPGMYVSAAGPGDDRQRLPRAAGGRVARSARAMRRCWSSAPATRR